MIKLNFFNELSEINQIVKHLLVYLGANKPKSRTNKIKPTFFSIKNFYFRICYFICYE